MGKVSKRTAGSVTHKFRAIKKGLAKTANPLILFWRPQRDLNPRYWRERPVSWTRLDDGDAIDIA